MKLKEIVENEIYYYTEVFENASEIISVIETLDFDEESFPVLEK
jgi:cephalosporin-C deacetylase-like acetyl esterase